MKKVLIALVVVCWMAGVVWAGSYVYYDAVTLNGNSSTNQTTDTNSTKGYMQTLVVCDKEASGSVDVSAMFVGMTDYAAEETIDLTGTDRTVVWIHPCITSINFDSGDNGTCRVYQAEK